jgi:hemerythrin-like domain-containing protein
VQEIRYSVERLARTIQEGGSNRAATAAMSNLAEGIQGLVQHMRTEQQMVREWVESQAEQQQTLNATLDRLVNAAERDQQIEPGLYEHEADRPRREG